MSFLFHSHLELEKWFIRFADEQLFSLAVWKVIETLLVL